MLDKLEKFTQFDAATWALFSSVLSEQRLQKGAIILQPGQICKQIFFVHTGLLRSFHVQDGEERNVAFGLENSFVTDLKSLRHQQPADLTIQAMEPSIVFSMAKADLIKLYEQSHPIETLGRQLIETFLEEQQEYASWFTRYSAKERYEVVVKNKPLLIQRVSLSQLASYLGIRRETLSRLRRLK